MLFRSLIVETLSRTSFAATSTSFSNSNSITFSEEQRDEKLSLELRKIYEEEGIETLLKMLSEFDIDSANRLKTEKNPKRIIRAIEFYKTTGTTITEQNKKSKLVKSPYNPIKIGLNFKDRSKLYERVNKRVDIMLESGLLNEAKEVISNKLSLTSVKAIGYKELLPYFNGEKTLEDRKSTRLNSSHAT